jgi:uncharacterized membrane protein (UPF0182 family)
VFPVTRVVRVALLAVAALLFFGVPSIARLYTDWLWFGEVGYAAIFTTSLGTRLALAAVAFAVTAGWLFLNLRVAITTLRFSAPVIWSGQQGVRIELPGQKQLRVLALGVSLLLAIPAAFWASHQWMTWLTFRHGVPFGVKDPVLGFDASFYVFTMPALDALQGAVTALIVVAALGASAIYALAGVLGLAPTGGVVAGRPAVRHLSLLAAAFFAMLALGAWLEMPHAMTSASGLVHGASYADVAVRFPAARLLVAVALVGIVLAALASRGRARYLGVAVGLYVLVSFGGEAWASAVQRFVVAPNEQGRETPYMLHNIEATRRAFAIDRVEERELSGDAVLTQDDIASNAATLRNVRLWDHRPLLDTFGQLQEIRPYYDFVSVDNDRYVIDGELRQVMLSARELNSQALPNRTWINERLTFTHGYGITLGPVNQVTQEGLPVLFVRDLPPVSTVDLPVTQPAIYFGELPNDYVLVGTSAREFHYPRGEDNVTAPYTGKGGVPIGSWLNRLLFAARFGSQQILFSSDITAQSRVLFHRRIRERVAEIAPFLWYDDDPYLVVAEGRLVWLQDAYTWTGDYPYSTPAANGINYVRNAVKIAIDAYDGTTTFYLADANDPIARTYQRMFPSLFRPLAEMPAALRAHIRYPEQLFGLQTAMYSTFHMTNPEVYYNKEDQWEVPTVDGPDGQAEPMEPYYAVMTLPGETKAEFIQMVPLTPRRKDNLAAWMAARSDEEHYGRLLVFRFPKQKVVFGPRQVIARINQDQAISPQVTLWNQQGSQVIQGTLLVIPIKEALLYVRPLYLRGAGGRIPELKRVIVAYQSTIVMETSLEAALDRLFGAGTTRGMRLQTDVSAPAAAAPTGDAGAAPRRPAGAAGPEFEALAAEAREHYERAVAAQREGNWAAYGEEIKKLGEVLERMKP